MILSRHLSAKDGEMQAEKAYLLLGPASYGSSFFSTPTWHVQSVTALSAFSGLHLDCRLVATWAANALRPDTARRLACPATTDVSVASTMDKLKLSLRNSKIAFWDDSTEQWRKQACIERYTTINPSPHCHPLMYLRAPPISDTWHSCSDLLLSAISNNQLPILHLRILRVSSSVVRCC